VSDYVLTLSCRDRVGLVAAVSGFLADRGCNILDNQQFTDTSTATFFMRVHFVATGGSNQLEMLRGEFAPVGMQLAMQWNLTESATLCRVLVMVSRFGHCLNDLLYRWQIGALHAEIVAVVSNHVDFAPVADAHGLPFHHLPVSAQNKSQQEAVLVELLADYEVDLLVLARYMQVLSDELCSTMPGRIINIHHSFLPSFKGSRPYEQAFDRGVKLIGATAHYATADLDEGPIIEQEVARIDHTFTPDRLAAVGRDLEAHALSRAVLWHAEQRVLLNGSMTVVFS
jgi:formyltetrahydrofolate deformylase